MSTDSWAGRPVLVTGGTGFIGRHLVRRLVAEGADVTLISRRAEGIGAVPGHGQYRLVVHDFSGAASWPDVTPSEVVFHLAAHGVERPFDAPQTAIAANVGGTARLLDLVAGLGAESLRAFVYASTDFELGSGTGAPRTERDELRPANTYAASKAAGWLFCRAANSMHGTPVVGTRIFLSYGPDQGARRLVPYAILAALRNQPLRLSSGRQQRDLVFIDDVVDGLLAAALTGEPGEMYNLGTGRAASVRQVVERVLFLSGSSAVAEFGAVPDRAGEIHHLVADPARSTSGLKWTASIGLDEGLTRAIDWYRDHLHMFPA